MSAVRAHEPIPLCGAKWAAKSEAYAALTWEHISPTTVWLDAGCGSRLLEDDLDPLEHWLAGQARTLIGVDPMATSHRNIRVLVQGSLDHLPFPSNCLDLVTCRMVVEHLDNPMAAFSEIHRCLRPSGAVVIITPNLHNYGVFGNALAAKLLKEEWRVRLLQFFAPRSKGNIFPVHYRANTMPRLRRLLQQSGLNIHKQVELRQHLPHWKKTAKLELLFMKLTPISALMVCAHKNPRNTVQRACSP